MKTYKVTVLKAGTMKVDKSILTRGTGCGEMLDVPARVVAVEGAGVKLLVNTGLCANAAEKTRIEGIVINNGGADELEKELQEKLGWKAEDVTAVVNTSLHFQCCGNNAMFPNASVYVQKAEWEYAHAPSLNQTGYYDSELLSNGAGAGVRLILVEGECEIAEGLILLPTAGVTRGHQSLLVNMEEGVVCCAGEAVNTMENLRGNIISNVLDDTRSAFASMRTISRTSEYIIPAFDTSIKEGASGNFPRTHEA